MRALSTPILSAMAFGAAAATVYGALSHLGSAADELAEREYQTQQRILAGQAAERLGDLLMSVGLFLEGLDPPESEALSETEWLNIPAPTEVPTIVFVHNDDAQIIAVSPGATEEQLGWLRGGEAKPILTVTRELRGREGYHLTAALDQRAIHQHLFASLARTHDSYVWVMDRYQTIVSAPDPSSVGTRPFVDLPEDIAAEFGPVLESMTQGESGAAAYRWRDDTGERVRLAAYQSVPGRPDLSVAYSADRASVLELTHELHQRQQLWLLILLGALALTGLALGWRVVRRFRDQLREASRLGPYTLGTQLGAGGMGVVYQAHHALLRRPTAIKLVPPERAGPKALQRFEREVQMTARLTHPNTITVYDYGHTPEGVFYYAMELVDGPTLRQVVEDDGAQTAARVLHLLRQAAGALAEAHEVGLIHRDIKPENIMVCERGKTLDVVKVLDFGLVRHLDEMSDQGTVAGTPLYMAPEVVLEPAAIDERSDVYALGAVGYYLLTGTEVFDGKSVAELCRQHAREMPTRPSDRLGAALPKDLEDVLLDCLAKKPADRPRNARDLLARLEACAEVGAWSEEDALAWWDGHVVRRSTPEVSERSRAPTMMTMTLDRKR
ncbi:MAG: protein kinase [Myxococcota bacterium]